MSGRKAPPNTPVLCGESGTPPLSTSKLPNNTSRSLYQGNDDDLSHLNQHIQQTILTWLKKENKVIANVKRNF